MYAVIPVTIDFVNLQYTGKSTLLQMWGHFILSKKQKTILSAFGLSDIDVKSMAIKIDNQLSGSPVPADEPTEEDDDYGEDTFDIID